MSAHSYEDLSRHIGHDIECVGYGGEETPIYVNGELVGYDRQYANAAIECVDCNEVLLDFDHPENESPRPTTERITDEDR